MIVHIILMILAILASIFGILLSLLLLFLIVPIRYRGKISKYEVIDGDFSIGWLFSILYGKIGYHNEKLSIIFCIFGYQIWNNQKKRQKRLKTKKNQKKIKEPEETIEIEIKPELKEIPSSDKEEKKELPLQEEPYQIERIETEEDSFQQKEKKKKRKIYAFFHTLKRKIQRVFAAIRAIPKNFHRILESIKQIFHNLDLIQLFLKLEINQQGIKSIFHTGKRIFNHLKPANFKLSLHFGFDDPSITGQVLGGAAILYSIFGEQIKMSPEFENEVLEGKLELKGRIRTGTLLLYVFQLLTKKEFRQLLKNFKILKEEL